MRDDDLLMPGFSRKREESELAELICYFMYKILFGIHLLMPVQVYFLFSKNENNFKSF